MYISTWTQEKGWDAGSMQPYGPLQMYPSAQVLNYGQSAFEGMKAQHAVDGRIVLFRPDKNAERIFNGAARLSMPAVPMDKFVEAVKATVAENKDWVGAKVCVLSSLSLLQSPSHSCSRRLMIAVLLITDSRWLYRCLPWGKARCTCAPCSWAADPS